MFLAEIDPIQIIIIVIAMGAGFVQWLWGLFKQSQEEKERRNAGPLSDEDRAAREEAWKSQTAPGNPQARPSPRTPPPVQDPWATVRDVFEQIKEETRKAQQPPPPRPAAPPPLPASTPTRRPASGTVRADLRPVPKPLPVPADPFPAGGIKTTSVPTPPVSFAAPPTPPRVQLPPISASAPAPTTNSDFPLLNTLLSHPAALRQAVLLREILGPPKALQSSGDSPF